MTHSNLPNNFLFYLLGTFLAFILFIFWLNYKIHESDKSEEKSPEKSKEGAHVVNQMDIVLGHIEIYGSICKDEAFSLYGIKNLKAVIHKMRSKMKIKVINIYHPGTQKFYGYGIMK
jgi:hypothetical protein